jgi:hypothetical protein
MMAQFAELGEFNGSDDLAACQNGTLTMHGQSVPWISRGWRPSG